MKVLYYIEKRLSDRYKDHECHWFVDWMITEDNYSMSKYTFKTLAFVEGIPFDEYTNDKAKWHKKKSKEPYPDISKFITYPDDIDEMKKIYENTDWRKPESIEELFNKGLLVKQYHSNNLACLELDIDNSDKNKYRIIKKSSSTYSSLDRTNYTIHNYKVFDTYKEALTACIMKEAEDDEIRKRHLLYDFYDAIDWYINYNPELEKIRSFKQTLPYDFGFRFLYSKMTGELFYKSCYNEEMRLIWKMGE